MPRTSDDDIEGDINVDAEPGVGAGGEELVAGRSLIPTRAQVFITGRSGRRLAVALLCLAVLACALVAVVQWHRHTERVTAEHRAAVVAQQAARLRTQTRRRDTALDHVGSWAADDDPFGITTLSSTRTPGCRNVDGQVTDPPQTRVSHELLTAFPGFEPRALSRTIDESGRLCTLLVSVSDGRAVIVLRAGSMLRRTFATRSASGVRDGDSVGYVSADSPGGWITVIGWHGPAGYVPALSVVRLLAEREATRW